MGEFDKPIWPNVRARPAVLRRAVVSRDWNRIEAELETVVVGNRKDAHEDRRRSDRKVPLAGKPDTDAVLKQIAEALRRSDD